MLAKEFTDKYHDKWDLVNSPDHRDAPIPPFRKGKINPSEFEDELRPKYYELLKITDNKMYLSWTSQEWSRYQDSFFKEVERYFKYIADKENLEERVEIEVTIVSRDGCTPVNRTIDIVR